MRTPVLLACAHGTDNRTGQLTISSIVAQIQAQLPQTRVIETYVDVQHPQVGEVIDAVEESTPTVVVPLLLSSGYHVAFDIARAVEKRSASGPSYASTPLGPHKDLALIQKDRINDLNVSGDLVVVVGAAGSSDARAQEDVEQQVALLREALGEQVHVRHGYLSAAEPKVHTVVEEALEEFPNATVVINSYLLAPGFFHNKLDSIAVAANESRGRQAVQVTQPLGADSRLASIAVERYLDAVTHL